MELGQRWLVVTEKPVLPEEVREELRRQQEEQEATQLPWTMQPPHSASK